MGDPGDTVASAGPEAVRRGSGRRRVPGWWLPAVAAIGASALASAVVLAVEVTSPRPPPGRAIPRPPLSARDGAVHIAGTGTSLPLMRSLAEAYGRGAPDAARPVVHGSIGSGGGLRALSDGVIDIGLMGIPEGASRDPPPGVELRRIALAAVAVAVHPSVPDRALTSAEVVDLYSGRRSTWSDGSPVVLLLREEGDSATAAARRSIPGLDRALEVARRAGRYPTLITDADMAQALESTPGGVGFHDAGSIHLEGRAIVETTLDGARPTRQAVEDGSYPIRRFLVLALPTRRRPEVQRFVEFVASGIGQGIIAAAGYVPLSGLDRPGGSR